MPAYLQENGMNWARLVVVGAGLVSSITDWFFAGDWIHRRYTYPEIWRQGAEGRAIALTQGIRGSEWLNSEELLSFFLRRMRSSSMLPENAGIAEKS